MKKAVKNGGFMMIEALVAASIITASILAATAVAYKSVYISRQAFRISQASFLLEEGAEAVRIARDNAWSNISSLMVGTNYYPTFLHGTWVLSTTANTVDIFTRKVVLTNVNRDDNTKDIVDSGGTLDNDAKLVTVTVSWIEGGTTVVKTLQFYIMDIFS